MLKQTHFKHTGVHSLQTSFNDLEIDLFPAKNKNKNVSHK